jgi:hypothetical protein
VSETYLDANQGGAVLTCVVCGPLDQGDSPTAMARMRKSLVEHERLTCDPSQTSAPVDALPADRALTTSAHSFTPSLAASGPDQAADVAGSTR